MKGCLYYWFTLGKLRYKLSVGDNGKYPNYSIFFVHIFLYRVASSESSKKGTTNADGAKPSRRAGLGLENIENVEEGCKTKTLPRDNNSLPTNKNIQRSRKNIQNKIDLSSTIYTDNNFSQFLLINFDETPARSVNPYIIDDIQALSGEPPASSDSNLTSKIYNYSKGNEHILSKFKYSKLSAIINIYTIQKCSLLDLSLHMEFVLLVSLKTSSKIATLPPIASILFYFFAITMIQNGHHHGLIIFFLIPEVYFWLFLVIKVNILSSEKTLIEFSI